MSGVAEAYKTKPLCVVCHTEMECARHELHPFGDCVLRTYQCEKCMAIRKGRVDMYDEKLTMFDGKAVFEGGL